MPPHYSISSAGDFHPEMPGSKDEQDGYDLGRNTENPGWGQHAHNEGVGKDHLCAHLGKDCATDVVKDRKPFDDHAKEVAGEKNNGNAHAKSEEEQEKVSLGCTRNSQHIVQRHGDVGNYENFYSLAGIGDPFIHGRCAGSQD